MKLDRRDIWRRVSLLIAACFWYCLGMKVRARNRFQMAFGSHAPAVNRNLKRAPDICNAQNQINPDERSRMEEIIATWTEPPLISIVMPVYNTSEEHLRAAIQSIREQVYPHWQLCIADDASTAPHIKPLLQKLEEDDPRIKVIFRQENGHISRATNSALTLAKGKFVALMDHDDTLPSHALYHVAREIMLHPDVDLIYSDEDKIREDGSLSGPHFKPDWNEELLLTQNYINHFSIIRRSILERVGGLRPGFEGSQDHDLVLRVALETSEEKIRHIPRILYHWRAFHGSNSFSDRAREQSIEARQRAVRSYLKQKHPEREVSVTEGPYGCNRITYHLPSPAPKVSIIIPSRDQIEHLSKCIASIFGKTAYPDYEVIILDNDSASIEAKSYFTEVIDKFGVRILPFAGPFNYAALNNFGVEKANGDVVVLLNNDTEVITDTWLSDMVSYAIRPEIGAVGAKLLYEDGSIQHAGVILGVAGVADHAFRCYPANHTGYNARLQLPQYISAVTGACLAVEKSRYLKAGGLDADRFKVAYNDVDFCLKLSALGLHNVYVPYATLYHHESISRGKDTTPEKMARLMREADALRDKWGDKLSNDPHYNENFTTDNSSFEFSPPDQTGRVILS